MVARVLLVSDEDGDVAFDLLSTDQPERYSKMGVKGVGGSFVIPFEYISSVQEVERSRDSG